jgi:HD-GYP domain-containing protein (c-di-GMP phosphodiesterase class II)
MLQDSPGGAIALVSGWWRRALLLGAPLLLFALLLRVPRLDGHLGSPTSHFYIVSAAAALAVVMAIAVLLAARRLPDPRTLFLSLGFLSIATIFLAHGLGTSPLFKQGETVRAPVQEAASASSYPSAVPAAYAHAAASGAHGSGATQDSDDDAAQSSSQAGSDAADRGRVVGYSARLSIFVSALAFALAVVDLPARTARLLLRGRWLLTLLATGLLGGHVFTALWHPGVIAWVPIGSAPLSQALAAVTWAALGFAAWRFFQSYRIALLPLQGAMATAMVLLMQAQLFMLAGRLWRLSWWEYHVVMFVGFLIAVIALLRQYRITGDLGAIVEGLFLRKHVSQLRNGDELALSSLTAAIAAKDTETAEHLGRVGDLAVAIARHLGHPEDRLERVRLAGQLHDVGKIGVPDSILRKPGPLVQGEFEIMKGHCARGWSLAVHSEYLADIAPVIRAHHERMDGRGYPDGLAGEDIPIEARIVAVADMWDALICARPYRAALSEAQASAIVRAASGTHLDPRCVDALFAVVQSSKASRRSELPRTSAVPVARFGRAS